MLDKLTAGAGNFLRELAVSVGSAATFDRTREFVRRTSIAVADAAATAIFVAGARSVYGISFGSFPAHAAAATVEFTRGVNPILGKLFPWLTQADPIASVVAFAALTGVLATTALAVAAVVAVRSRLAFYASAEQFADWLNVRKIHRFERDFSAALRLAETCDFERLTNGEMKALRDATEKDVARLCEKVGIQVRQSVTFEVPRR